jgi:hypothetical protein
MRVTRPDEWFLLSGSMCTEGHSHDCTTLGSTAASLVWFNRLKGTSARVSLVWHSMLHTEGHSHTEQTKERGFSCLVQHMLVC